MTPIASWYPDTMDTFIGQDPLRKQLSVELVSSIAQKRPLHHAVFYGPGGLGKTTLIEVLARERGCPKPTLLIGKSVTHELLTDVLASLQSDGYDNLGNLVNPAIAQFPIVVIDEAQTVPPALLELLHPVLEPGKDGRRIMLGRKTEGRELKQWPIWVIQFTCILITNYYGMMLKRSSPTLSRFPIKHRFEFYSDEEIVQVICQFAQQLGASIDSAAADLLASRSNGVPREAVNFVRRATDFTVVSGHITEFVVRRMLDVLGYDDNGLDPTQLAYLKHLVTVGHGRLGIEVLAALLGCDRQTIELAVEPALFRKGLVTRASYGREITNKGKVTVLGRSGASPMYSRAV